MYALCCGLGWGKNFNNVKTFVSKCLNRKNKYKILFTLTDNKVNNLSF